MAIFTDLPSDVLVEVYLRCGPLTAATLLQTSQHAVYGWEHSEIKWMARWRPTACFKGLILKKDHSKAMAILACVQATPGARLDSLLAVAASTGADDLVKACLDAGSAVEAQLRISLQVLHVLSRLAVKQVVKKSFIWRALQVEAAGFRDGTNGKMHSLSFHTAGVAA
jgi:hypothetical protein